MVTLPPWQFNYIVNIALMKVHQQLTDMNSNKRILNIQFWMVFRIILILAQISYRRIWMFICNSFHLRQQYIRYDIWKFLCIFYTTYLYQMGVSLLWLKGLLMCYGPVIITMIIILVLYTQMDSRRVLPRRKHDGKSSTNEYIEKYERWKKTK